LQMVLFAASIALLQGQNYTIQMERLDVHDGLRCTWALMSTRFRQEELSRTCEAKRESPIASGRYSVFGC
jgi:hypothetical protein